MIQSILLLAPAAQTITFLLAHILASCKKQPRAADASTLETDDRSRTKNRGGTRGALRLLLLSGCSSLARSLLRSFNPLLPGETDAGERDDGMRTLLMRDLAIGLLTMPISAFSSTEILIPISSRMVLRICMDDPKKTDPLISRVIIFGN
jgi:hypothetical protein